MTYTGIDLRAETLDVSKMDAWLVTPRVSQDTRTQAAVAVNFYKAPKGTHHAFVTWVCCVAISIGGIAFIALTQ